MKRWPVYTACLLVVAICWGLIPPAAAQTEEGHISLKEDTLIEMSFKSADIRDVLRLLSKVANINLITDASVRGEFTVHLAEITFQEALEFITFANQLAYKKVGNTYIVTSRDRIQELGEKEVLTQVFYLEYAEPQAMKGLLQTIIPDAVLEVDERLNAVVVKAELAKLTAARDIIYELDAPKALISVEVRVDEVSSRELEEMGVAPGQLANIKILQDLEGIPAGIGLDFPSLIRMLEEEGAARNLASPRLTTLDGIQGRLLIGDRIPVRVEEVRDDQVTSTINYIEVGILIEFTPRVSSDGYITLTVRPEVSTIGEQVTGEGFPHIRTREAETVVRIKSGDTFTIGGLIQSREIESMAKVPFLAELPILGEIFKRSQLDETGTELLISITPEIIDMPTRRQAEGTANNGVITVTLSANNNEQAENGEDQAAATDNTNSTPAGGTQTNNLPAHIARWLELFMQGEPLYRSETEEAEEAAYFKSSAGIKEETDPPSTVAGKTLHFSQSRIIAGIAIEYYLTYQVRESDNLWRIGYNFGIPYQWIQAVNDIEDDVIQPGQLLFIPIPASHIYTVQAGDTLLEIADRHQLEVQAIIDINTKLDDLIVLPVGLRLIMPRPAVQ